MKKILLALLLGFGTSLTNVYAQGPPKEVDEAIRGTIQFFMGSGNNYDAFIEKYYSKNLINSSDLETLKGDLQEMKKSTEGAGGIDVGVEGNSYKIKFSDGSDAIVALTFDPNEKGKIQAIQLEEMPDPSEMTSQQRFQYELENKIRIIESLPRLDSDEEFNLFINENFTKAFKSLHSQKKLIEILKKSSVAIASSMTISARPWEENGDGVVLEFRGPKSADIAFMIEEEAPYLINAFEFSNSDKSPGGDRELIPMTWDDYKSKIQEEVSKGFSGVVFVVRDGKFELKNGYGMANKEKSIRNSDKTVFDVGSIPIDFTRAAILKLVDDGKVSYQDPITKFFDGVPSDKKMITIGNIMNDESGLQNFHHDESKDQDFDLTWISRDEAVDRILSRPLLAKPGTEFLPSHSSYGLLAAIVEIVSGKTYQEFLEINFFKPLKMHDTKHFGPESGIKTKRMAVGYGKQVSDPNIPTEWGKTSWMIKGSGGMVSTPSDLYKFISGIQNGEYLSDESKTKFRLGRPSFGGSERGFLTCYLKDSKNTVIICSNSPRDQYDGTMILFKSLAELVK